MNIRIWIKWLNPDEGVPPLPCYDFFPSHNFLKTTSWSWLDYRLVNAELFLEARTLFYLFCFCAGSGHPTITHLGSSCLSYSAEGEYDVFLKQTNEQSVKILKPVLHTESRSCCRDPVTHVHSYGLCLQCQEQELFSSDFFFGIQVRENHLESIRDRQRALASSVLRTVNKPRFEGRLPFNLRYMLTITITGFHYYLIYSKYFLLGKGDFLKTMAVLNVLIE